jgi:hypothetical protein
MLLESSCIEFAIKFQELDMFKLKNENFAYKEFVNSKTKSGFGLPTQVLVFWPNINDGSYELPTRSSFLN